MWEKNPDLRLGQLINNLGHVYYVEDEDLVEKIARFDPKIVMMD